MAKTRRFQVYESIGDNPFGKGTLYWRTACEHSNGSKDTEYSESEARAKCDELKKEGTKFKVEEVINVTKEFV